MEYSKAFLMPMDSKGRETISRAEVKRVTRMGVVD